jgi:hypothetical protein
VLTEDISIWMQVLADLTDFFRNWQSLSWSVNFPPFVKAEVSLPCSQNPTTETYSEILRSNPLRHTIFIRSLLNLSSHLRLRFSNSHFPSRFLTKIVCTFIISPCVLHVTPWFYRPNNVWWKVKPMKHLIM